MSSNYTERIQSVAIIGGGASGAAVAEAFTAEKYYSNIRVFERRPTTGGTWNYDPDPGPPLPLYPGKFPPDVDLPEPVPEQLPQTTARTMRERYGQTPIYASLTTNVPAVAMAFPDVPFPDPGPYVSHSVPRQYVVDYFARHDTARFVSLNTTVEDLTRVPGASPGARPRWRLTLRRHDQTQTTDDWWAETFDAVVLANGHYAVPYVPAVQGLATYMAGFPGRVMHAKQYRTPDVFAGRHVVVVGNSASGRDVTADLVRVARLPVHQSRRKPAPWEDPEPPEGTAWHPIITEFRSDGAIVFADDTVLTNVDAVIYCTGYRASFPFWNAAANGRALWNESENRLAGGYWHTFVHDEAPLGIVGLPRVLAFRSFAYQAVALARLWSGRAGQLLPSLAEQKAWETERAALTLAENRPFHHIEWLRGETKEFVEGLAAVAGLGRPHDDGRLPAKLPADVVAAVNEALAAWSRGLSRGKEGTKDGTKDVDREKDTKEVTEKYESVLASL